MVAHHRRGTDEKTRPPKVLRLSGVVTVLLLVAFFKPWGRKRSATL
jgi:hypothetical protein